VGIIAKLKQRRIVQIVVSYLAGAWIVLSALDQFADRGIIPELVYQIGFVWAFVGGLPAALIIGWYHGEKGAQEAPPSEIAMLVVIAIVTMGLSGFTAAASREIPLAELDDGLEARKVAVMYFEHQGLDPEQEFLADALAEDLIEELSQVRGLDVVSRNGSQLVRSLNLPRDSIARRLQVGTLVEGMVERRRDRLEIGLRLFDGRSGVELQDGRASFSVPVAEALGARDELVVQAAQLLRQRLGSQLAIERRGSGTSNAQAWSHVQQAERLRKEGVAAAQAGDVPRANELFDRAHDLLTRAESLDAAWAEPIILRSEIEYHRVRIIGLVDPRAARNAAHAGIAHAERALGKNRDDARAHMMRGVLRFNLHLLGRDVQGVVADRAELTALRDGARADLLRATQLDPSLAFAYSWLAHLYSGESTPSAVLAAQKALEEDAFLESARDLMIRLFAGSYDLGLFTEAQRWCEEGTRRFPDDHMFVVCQLYVLASPAPGTTPDVERGWRLVARIDSLAPPLTRERQHIQARLRMATVLARAATATARNDADRAALLADSARSTVAAALAQIDPADPHSSSVIAEAAEVHVVLGEHDEAIALLRRVVAGSHGFRADGQAHWRWRPLQNHPGFRELISAAHH
jgi:eukaryotic-like serine/threonine-protein kinase